MAFMMKHQWDAFPPTAVDVLVKLLWRRTVGGCSRDPWHLSLPKRGCIKSGTDENILANTTVPWTMSGSKKLNWSHTVTHSLAKGGPKGGQRGSYDCVLWLCEDISHNDRLPRTCPVQGRKGYQKTTGNIFHVQCLVKVYTPLTQYFSAALKCHFSLLIYTTCSTCSR